MKTQIKNTEKHDFIIPAIGDMLILRKGIKRVSIYNGYGQEMGDIPISQTKECLSRMNGMPITVIVLYVDETDKGIVIDIHFGEKKILRDAYVIELQKGRLEERVDKLQEEYDISFALQIDKNRKSFEKIKDIKAPKKKRSVLGLYYKGEKVVKNEKKKR